MRSIVHRGAIDDRLCLVRALGRELGDIVAWRERFLAGTMDDDAAKIVIGRKGADRLAQPSPHSECQRVELLGTIEHNRGDCAFAGHRNRFAHLGLFRS
jgi:hypothetical protein